MKTQRLRYIKRVLLFLTTIKIKFIFKRNLIRISHDSNLNISHNCNIKSSKIFLSNNATLNIGKNCIIENVHIYLYNGKLSINDNCIIRSNDKMIVDINNGIMMISNNVKLSLNRIWVRFGGKLKIGKYTNINSGGEIRCDEEITIGEFNQISYNVMIWDTNTHNIYSPTERRKLTIEHFPYFGWECEKPKTKKIVIGNDNWIAKNVTILKGCYIENNCIIGYGTILSNVKLASNSTIIEERNYKIIK